MNGYGVRGGGNPALGNGGLNGGLNGGINGGINGGLNDSLDNGLTVTEDDNAIAYYDHEADDAGVTSPLLGNGTAIAMAAAAGNGNGNVTGAALEPEMMQGGSSAEDVLLFPHFDALLALSE